jgi:malate dehydrogenase (oxaloacetate-decarboxylating)
LFPREAAAVGAEAVKQGVARVRLSRKELYERANAIITHARKTTELLMRRGLIKGFPVRIPRGGDRRVIQG